MAELKTFIFSLGLIVAEELVTAGLEMSPSEGQLSLAEVESGDKVREES